MVTVSSSGLPAFEHRKYNGVTKNYAGVMVSDSCPLGYVFINFNTLFCNMPGKVLKFRVVI